MKIPQIKVKDALDIAEEMLKDSKQRWAKLGDIVSHNHRTHRRFSK